MAYNPLIIIPAPAISPLNIVDSDGNIEKQAWPVKIDQQALTDTLKGSLMKMMLLRKDAGFSDSIAKIAEDAVEPLSVNSDGTKKYNVKANEIKRNLKNCSDGTKELFNKAFPTDAIINAIGEENIYLFTYDMFGDIYTAADALNDFICNIKNTTGTEKADILCVSLGGVILKAYLAEYSHKNDIGKVISIASLINGTSLIADAFENKLVLNDAGPLLSLLGEKGDSLSSAIKMLPQEAIENTVTKCTDIIRNKLLCSCTMMWACIPNDRFDAIYSSLIKSGSELDKKVSKLHNYSKNLNNELKALQAKGMQFYQLCGYGKNLIPIAKNPEASSDGIVEASLASFGAAFSSVDSAPDCSKCLFGDTTLFYKNEEHFSIQKNKDLIADVAKILTDN